MDEPSKEAIFKFCEAVSAAFTFEAQTRMIRGYGCFRAEDCPMPEVVEVERWLRWKAGYPEVPVVEIP